MLEILIQSNYIPTYFSGRIHRHQGSPNRTNQNTATVNCLLYHAHTDSLCVPKRTVLDEHRHTALLKPSGTMEFQTARVGTCTIVGIYWYVCVCVYVGEYMRMREYMRICVCVCVWLLHRQTTFQHVSVVAITIIRTIPPPWHQTPLL